MGAWLRGHSRLVWWAVLLPALSPGLVLLLDATRGALGANPLERLQDTTGRQALLWLTVTLSITPLRRALSHLARRLHLRDGKRLADWNWIVRLRRMLGLVCFAWAAAHALVFFHLDLGWDMAVAGEEFVEKPYLGAGLTAFILLVPLALTSTDGMLRRLGRDWRRLHRAIYAIAVLALIHWWWLLKPGLTDAWPYTLVLGVLLGYRILAARRIHVFRPQDDGMPVPERSPRGEGAERRG